MHALLACLPLALPGAAAGAPATVAPSLAPQTTAAQEVAAGRSLLDTDPARALAHFERAHELEPGPATERWVVRAWIALGRVDDAIDRAQALEEEGAAVALTHYLLGHAFAKKAELEIASGGGMADMFFADTVTYFRSALESDPQRYGDAWGALAHAAWQARQLDVARDAAEKAVARPESGARERFVLGRIAFSQYSAAKDDEARKEEAQARWDAARDAFDAAIEELDEPTTPANRTLLAEVSIQRAYLNVWGEELDAARDDFVRAMTWDPTQVDYGAMLEQLGDERFLVALEEGATGFRDVYGERTQSDATLLWWLGWARHRAKDYAGAEEAMRKAVEKFPAYANAWWTIAEARFAREDFDGATEAVFRFHDAQPEGLTATIRSNPGMNLALLEGLVGHYAKGYEAQRDAEAALRAARLAEIQAAAAPDHSPYWNNAGLFHRDAGEYLALSKDSSAEEKRRGRASFEASLENYTKALELEPQNPIYLNDTAVILHYYLDRDLERALEMYREATRLANAQLDAEDDSHGTKDEIRIALRDSKDNAAKLERLLEHRREQREKEEREKERDEESGGDGDGDGSANGGR